MGTIMSIGVATSNSVLVITFANEHFAENKDAWRAALEAGANSPSARADDRDGDDHRYGSDGPWAR